MNQPRSVYWLLVVHTLERFGFWGMRGLLVLYMIESVANGGMAWAEADGVAMAGWLGGVLYLAPSLGGLIADGLIGGRFTVTLGALCMAVGIGVMALNAQDWFYWAILAVALGNGLFKPCITAALASEYEEGDPRREPGYQYLYQTVLIGVLGSSLICGWLFPNYGFPIAFGAASGAMVLAALLWQISPCSAGVLRTRKSAAQTITGNSPARILGLLLFAILFFAMHAQGGGIIIVYVHRYIERMWNGWEIPTLWLTMTGSVIGIFLTPPMTRVWKRVNFGPERKLAMGIGVTGVSFAIMGTAALLAEASGHKAPVYWLVAYYFFNILGKLCVMPVLNSTIERLSPPRWRNVLMGVTMGCIGLGSIVAGQVGRWVGEVEFSSIFTALSIICVLAALAAGWKNRPLETECAGSAS